MQGTTLERFERETSNPTDDHYALGSSDERVYLQAKNTINLSSKENSEFASVIKQFVEQFHSSHNVRVFDPEKDLLILATSSNSPNTIKSVLPTLLEQIRGLSPEESLESKTNNKKEEDALNIITTHLKRIWKEKKESIPKENELLPLLRSIRVAVYKFENNGSDRREAEQLLRTAILKNPKQSASTWKCLYDKSSSLASRKSGVDRQGLQKVLLDDGIELNASSSFQSDIDKLIAHSERTRELQQNLSEIIVEKAIIQIETCCFDFI